MVRNETEVTESSKVNNKRSQVAGHLALELTGCI
jgi:hypothetical protein